MSDLHLGPDTPRTLLALQRALQALDADALFILGDLFEAWVGDDARELPWAQAVVALLSTCAAARPVYFQHGNRDFLLGTAMAEACGLQLLAEEVCLQAFGQRVVLVHGDAECLEDRPYQAFRAQVRQPAWQQGFLAQPLATRLQLAAQMRDASQQAQADGPYADLDAQACAALLQRHGAQTLLHGHTHRPARHALPGGAQRLVLSDWDHDHGGARGEVMLFSPQGWQRLPQP
ncbi:UDP-2,3-diacylglucosamine diphosphatase [Inhella sp.]|uniref:UDP-2,3-diacylglucosamine diphosphatase n=1 Tax=Inhella sp. TaxID=1921806 RepID=UPI0035ADE532